MCLAYTLRRMRRFLVFAALFAVFGAATMPGYAAVQPGAPTTALHASFAVGAESLGVEILADGVLRLLPDAPPPPVVEPGFERYGFFISPGQEVDSPTSRIVVSYDATVPEGCALRVDVRGSEDGLRWTGWETEVAPNSLVMLPQVVRMVQYRVTFLGGAEVGPTLRSVELEPQDGAMAYGAFDTGSPAVAPTYRIRATRLGMVGGRTANGHIIKPHDRFVALPSWRSLNVRGGTDYQVRITYRGRSVVAPVWDVGPWNTHDDYWSVQRERFRDLRRGWPQDHAAYFDGYNGGYAEKGWVRFPTAMDVGDGLWWELGIPGDQGEVEVTFLWLGTDPLVVPTPSPTPQPIAAPLPTSTAMPTPREEIPVISVVYRGEDAQAPGTVEAAPSPPRTPPATVVLTPTQAVVPTPALTLTQEVVVMPSPHRIPETTGPLTPTQVVVLTPTQAVVPTPTQAVAMPPTRTPTPALTRTQEVVGTPSPPSPVTVRVAPLPHRTPETTGPLTPTQAVVLTPTRTFSQSHRLTPTLTATPEAVPVHQGRGSVQQQVTTGGPSSVPLVGERVVVVVDEQQGPGFSAEASSAWSHTFSGCGRGDHALWALTTVDPSLETSQARWQPDLPREGTYDVQIYIPSCLETYPTTVSAHYVVHASDGTRRVVVNQAQEHGWVRIGRFPFAKGKAGFVSLSNVAGDSGHAIWFDEVRWVLAEEEKTTSNRRSDGTGE
ncbi:MAG: hypothetical protein HC884_02055 [Chloroflexaceae bacterium]|nr:hypothetical protein [Chloroflexaceae bacterium]